MKTRINIIKLMFSVSMKLNYGPNEKKTENESMT